MEEDKREVAARKKQELTYEVVTACNCDGKSPCGVNLSSNNVNPMHFQ